MDETKQTEFDGVYYDTMGDLFVLVTPTEDGARLDDAFTGQKFETLSDDEMDNFEEEFTEVSPEVVQNPTELTEKLLFEAANAASGGGTKFHRFSPTDIDFCMEAVELHTRDDPAYRERLGL